MSMVKQKINQAFANLNIAPKDNTSTDECDWEFVEHGHDTGEFVVEPAVQKKRIEYCASVRRRSAKGLRRSKDFHDAIYPQLFDYCLVVGLRQLVGTDGYEPYVMHKFPENASANLSVPNFCFPDAKIFRPGSATSLSEPYSFVMTYSDGSHVYGYCRRIQPPDASLPEVVCIISPVDAFNMYNTLLNEIETRRHTSFDLASEIIAASFGRPLPKPGKVCHIRMLDAGGDLETIFLNRSLDSRLENVNYESPLHYLGTDKLVKVFSSMLMERRIILCSNSLSVLTQTIQALAALLYPFHWQHVYIPLLPAEMLDAVCAPMPFIVGMLSSFLPKVLEMDLEEVLIVDLDKKNIIKSQGDESTILPKRVQKALKTAINMCKIDAEARNAQWLIVVEAFLRMFVETVGHFNGHVRTQQDGNKIFQKEGFIFEIVAKDVRAFLEWFTETQMFEVFIMNHLKELDVGTSDVFLQRLAEFKETRAESARHRGLGAKVKNLGKALKTKFQHS